MKIEISLKMLNPIKDNTPITLNVFPEPILNWSLRARAFFRRARCAALVAELFDDTDRHMD